MHFTDICYDSRKAVEKSLYIAIRERAVKRGDYQRYIMHALHRGAYVLEGTPETLAEYSAEFFGYPANSLRLIGVTGTNGKTTVTTLAKQVYERVTGEKCGLIGTIANYIGDEEIPTVNTTPESRDLHELFAKMRDAGCTTVFMEVSSHALASGRVSGLRFEVGAFTNFTQDHLDFHGSMEEYLAAKLKLYEMSEHFIIDERIDVNLPNAVTVDGADNQQTVLAICGALGLPENSAKVALSSAKPPKGRMEILDLPNADFTVIIDYAHTPDGLEYTLKQIRKNYPNSKITVLFGCGGDRDKAKRPIMGQIAEKLADNVIITSDNPRTEDAYTIIHYILQGMTKNPLAVIENRIDAINFALTNASRGDVILLAGKGHETYQIIGKDKIHLDEREIVNAKVSAPLLPTI